MSNQFQDPIAQAQAMLQRKRDELGREFAQLASPEMPQAPEDKMDFVAAVEAMLSKITPTPEKEYRARIFATEIIPKLKQAGFDERYWIQSLLDAGSNDARVIAQFKRLEALRAAFTHKGAIICLVGTRGTGKTTIAAQLAQCWFCEDDLNLNPSRRTPSRTVIYRKMTTLIARFKPLYGDFGTKDADALESSKQMITSCDLLIVDALEEGADDGKFKDRMLADFLDVRYARNLDTLLISNQEKESFEQTTNPSILDRMREHGQIIQCKWTSFRDKKPT